MSDRIDQLLEEILKFRRDHDWEKSHTPRNLAISIPLEAAELLENFQWQVGKDPITPEIKERACSYMFSCKKVDSTCVPTAAIPPTGCPSSAPYV